jgi:hypothetical protein
VPSTYLQYLEPSDIWIGSDMALSCLAIDGLPGISGLRTTKNRSEYLVAPPLAPALPANNLFQYDDEDEQRRSRRSGHFYDEYNPLGAPFSIDRRRIENEDNDRDKNGDNDRAEKIILAELHYLQIVFERHM